MQSTTHVDKWSLSLCRECLDLVSAPGHRSSACPETGLAESLQNRADSFSSQSADFISSPNATCHNPTLSAGTLTHYSPLSLRCHNVVSAAHDIVDS